MREQIAEILNQCAMSSSKSEIVADAIIAALPGMVPDLVWCKSHINPWDGDYHTVPTDYSIRGLGCEDYRLIFDGGFSTHNSPEAAKAAAQADYISRIMRALGVTEGE